MMPRKDWSGQLCALKCCICVCSWTKSEQHISLLSSSHLLAVNEPWDAQTAFMVRSVRGRKVKTHDRRHLRVYLHLCGYMFFSQCVTVHYCAIRDFPGEICQFHLIGLKNINNCQNISTVFVQTTEWVGRKMKDNLFCLYLILIEDVMRMTLYRWQTKVSFTLSCSFYWGKRVPYLKIRHIMSTNLTSKLFYNDFISMSWFFLGFCICFVTFIKP